MDFNDPTLWVAVGFIILIAGVYKPAKKALLGMLDGRIETIRRELDEAASLREEAQQTLADFQRKQRDAIRETDDMIARAEADAERLRMDGLEKLQVTMKRREQVAVDKIAQAEADALREIRERSVDIAIAATRNVIAARLDEEKSAALIDQSVRDLSSRLH